MASWNRLLGFVSASTGPRSNIPSIEITAPEATARDEQGIVTKMRKTSCITSKRYDYAIEIVCAGGIAFDIHHGLLRSSSPYFARKLKNIDNESVNLAWADPDIFEFVKEYLYIGRLPIVSREKPVEATLCITPMEFHTVAGSQASWKDDDFMPSDDSTAIASAVEGTSMVDDVDWTDDDPSRIYTPPSFSPMTGDCHDVEAPKDDKAQAASTTPPPESVLYVTCDSLTLTKLYYLVQKLEMQQLGYEVLGALIHRLDFEKSFPLAAIDFAYASGSEGSSARNLLVMYAARHASMDELRYLTAPLPVSALVDLLQQMSELRGPVIPWMQYADDAFKICQGYACE